MFEYSFYNDVCFHWGKLDKIILVEKYEDDHTWDNCLLFSTVEAGKPLLESVQHYYIILWFCLFVCFLSQELIQNAEDAGATEVRFLYDETQYGTETLWSKDMAQYQGKYNFY